MKKLLLAGVLSVVMLTPFSVFAALNVFACVPEWGALAKELGGDRVEVYTATTGLQDPHRVEARPSLIAKARRADLVACTGAGLEVGWLPMVLQQSGNARIQPGNPGYFEAAASVKMLEVPTRVDRSAGDVHPEGNPHIQTDPRNILRVSDALARRLAEIDPGNADYYAARHAAFSAQWKSAIQRWETEAAPLRGTPIVVQHQAFPYLSAWLGLKEVATLEPKPGIEPSSAYLAQVLAELKQKPAKMVIRAAYQSPRPSEWLATRAGIPAVALPFTVGGSAQAKDLYAMFDETVRLLLAARQ